MNKKIIVLMAVSILLTSCGGVTPVPMVTPTLAATAIPQLLSTVTPENLVEEDQPLPFVQLWTHLPPDQLVDQYELKEWSPDFYENMDVFLEVIDEKYYLYDQTNDFRAAFASEAWLNNGSKLDNNAFLCDIRRFAPGTQYIPGLRLGQDLFSSFVESLLNNEGITVDGLQDKIRDLIGSSECHFGFSLSSTDNIFFDPTYIENLFGDGQRAYVFTVGMLFTFDNKVAIYGVHSVNGSYRVEKIRNWERYVSLMSGTSIKLIDIGDVNSNGRNEIIVQVDHGSSGSPPQEVEWIYRYEWDPLSNTFVGGQRVTIFAQQCYFSACYGTWSFNRTADVGNLILTTQEYFNTGLDLCEYLIREKVYLLTNDTYSLKSDTLLVPENNSLACQVSWAYEILIMPDGWKNDKALQIISSAIDNWPKELNGVWGAQSKDYMQLMLGLWMDFRGESDRSFALLDPLRTQQRDTKPTFIAQLAQTYLSTREQTGIAAACIEVNVLQGEILEDKFMEEARKIMGFWAPRWIYFADDICNDKDAFSAAFHSSEVVDENSLNEWLLRQGKSDLYVKKVTIGNNEVWLASFLTKVISKYKSQANQSWAFFDERNRRNAVLLSEARLDDNETKSNISILKSEQSPPTLLVAIDDCLLFLSVSSGEVEILKNICGVNLYFSENDEQINIMFSDWYPGNWRFTSYKWNERTQSFQEVPSLDYDFGFVQDKAESLIYRENDYVGAIVYINNALLTSPPDQVLWPDCYDYLAKRADDIEANPSITLCEQPMEFHRPYLLYLLGISYEMSGQPDRAKSTYYSLWHDYPTNIFGFAASLKLEPMIP